MKSFLSELLIGNIFNMCKGNPQNHTQFKRLQNHFFIKTILI